MMIFSLNRHLTVASVKEALQIVQRKGEKNFWRVVSILEPIRKPVSLPGAIAVHRASFDDAENPPKEDEVAPWVMARPSDIQGIFDFAEHDSQTPLLVHCYAGLSRSAAVALALIIRGLAQAKAQALDDDRETLRILRDGGTLNDAHSGKLVDWDAAKAGCLNRELASIPLCDWEEIARLGAGLLLAIRPHARPNVHVLKLGLEVWMPPHFATDLSKFLVNHDAFHANRFKTL